MMLCRMLVILAQICTVKNKNLNVETLCLAVSDVRRTKTVDYSVKCLIKVTRFATKEVDWRCWSKERRAKIFCSERKNELFEPSVHLITT
jgi:hypothetical protein